MQFRSIDVCSLFVFTVLKIHPVGCSIEQQQQQKRQKKKKNATTATETK